MNLSIDVFAFGNYCFKNVNFRSIDFVKVAGPCKLRRIFTMKSPIFDDLISIGDEYQHQDPAVHAQV
jgi:hypothetical protein